MVLRIVTVGKVSDWARRALEHYSKMISRYARIEHIGLKTGGDLNRENPEVIKKREGRKILEKVTGELVCLDRKGRRMTSEEFAELLKGFEKATFVIGGPLGLSEEVLKACGKRISISDMTLSHEVALVVLLEQLFRAFKMIKGEKYHY